MTGKCADLLSIVAIARNCLPHRQTSFVSVYNITNHWI
jgi:hypothetical protein